MYIPEAFRVEDPARLHEFMRRNPFATLVSAESGVPKVSHLPLALGAAGSRLLGHFAKANDHWRSFEEPKSAVAIFHGAHGYVSPSMYVSRPNVPTWAYAVVHAHGPVRLLSLEESVDMLIEMVETYDPSLASTHPESTERDYVAKKARGIVAFELSVERLEGKFKVGQNKEDADRLSAGRALTENEDKMLQELGELYLSPPNC